MPRMKVPKYSVKYGEYHDTVRDMVNLLIDLSIPNSVRADKMNERSMAKLKIAILKIKNMSEGVMYSIERDRAMIRKNRRGELDKRGLALYDEMKRIASSRPSHPYDNTRGRSVNV